MPTYLIVANQTLAGPELADAIAERAATKDARFHVVVPATPIVHRLTWDEKESRDAATARLADIVKRIESHGATASGEVGVPDPIDAVHDAIRDRSVDEIILSTLPPGLSRWLGQDVPTRLRGAVDVPVVVVTAASEPVNARG
jgi:hypothetical protein